MSPFADMLPFTYRSFLSVISLLLHSLIIINTCIPTLKSEKISDKTDIIITDIIIKIYHLFLLLLRIHFPWVVQE